jgi:DNA-binding GntR family transcriptional regulator
VLEDLLLDGARNGSAVVASTNVRRVAGRLGISKDTVAAALRRLAASGLVTRVDARGRAGVFAPTRYRVAIDRLDGVRLAEEAIAPQRAVVAARRDRMAVSAQPSLFEDESAS